MIEQRGQSGTQEATEWLARGWNPFMPQTSDPWLTPAFNLMADAGKWHWWIHEHTDQLHDLARAAFASQGPTWHGGDMLSGAAATCYSRDPKTSMLGLLLYFGADPDSMGRPRYDRHQRDNRPALFGASRDGAHLLIDAGANPHKRDSTGRGCWEHWAERMLSGDKIHAEDLDWMAGYCPPSWVPAPHGLGARAIAAGCPDVVHRMIQAGATAEQLGLGSRERVASSLRSLARDADHPDTVELIAHIVGWPAVFEACSSDMPDQKSAVKIAAMFGRVKTLGVLERGGMFKSGKVSIEDLTRQTARGWWEAKHSRHDRSLMHQLSASGMVWTIGRLGATSCDIAREALTICVDVNPTLATRVALTCASKGFLPDSGPASIADLYDQGASWPVGPVARRNTKSHPSFAEFVALCENKSFKKTMPSSQAKKTSTPKHRL